MVLPTAVEAIEGIEALKLRPSITTLSLPLNPRSVRNYDFSPLYGRGCDVIVHAYQKALQGMLNHSVASKQQTLSLSSVSTYAGAGISTFLPFCVSHSIALGRDFELTDLNSHAVQLFISHLAEGQREVNGQKIVYTHVKSVLIEMSKRGWVQSNIFPKNPYPNINRKHKGETSLSKTERARVLNALKVAVKTIVLGDGALSRHELSICLLAVAARTGLNPAPLIELQVDCLQPHPLKADRKLLISFKRRGSNTHIQSLKKSEEVEIMTTALPDVSQLIELIIARNSGPRSMSLYPGSLCIYKRSYMTKAQFLLLSYGAFSNSIWVWTRLQGLLGDDGKPLRLNTMRLRKTFENRMWELSGQDPFLTAKLGGHTPKVSNDYYLEAPPEAENNWRLMGEVRVEELRQQTVRSSTTGEQNTPVARCKDTLKGYMAPGDGSHCQKFLACFRCRSFVVTGDDLHRLFSFYWMLVRERAVIGGRRWAKHYAHIIRIIDQQIAPRFNQALVEKARATAKERPHPFWRNAENLEGAS